MAKKKVIQKKKIIQKLFIKIMPKRAGVVHKLRPLHLFHNEEIDRWIVLMDCATCKAHHVFYPMN